MISALWQTRRLNGFEFGPPVVQQLNKLIVEDPLAVQPLVDFGLFEQFYSNAEAEGRAKVQRAAELYPTHPEVLRWLALSIWAEQMPIGEKILVQLRTVRPNDPDLLYDIACARTVAGDLDGAEVTLRAAIESGFREFDLMQVDADLRALRESGKLSRLLREFR